MKLIEEILDFLYPPRCVVCGKIALKINGDKSLCKKCRKFIPWIDAASRCLYCAAPYEGGSICDECKGRTRDYKRAVSLFEYSDVKTTVENYKFNGHKYLSSSIGTIMYNYASLYYQDILEACDIICPVPIHSERLKERGFDQSALIGKVISEKSGIEYLDALVRIRATVPQSTIKGYIQRQENVKGAFKAVKDVKDKTILIIDDVITTGSSVNECTKALLNAGAKEAYVFTFASSYKRDNK